MATLFTKIIRRELPATILFENERLIAIEDIHPVAPVHILIIAKKEIPNIQALLPEDYPLVGEIVALAQELAVKYAVADDYRLLTNNGEKAGQSIFHLHFHLIGGRPLGNLG